MNNSRLQDELVKDFFDDSDDGSTPKCSHYVRLQSKQETKVKVTQCLFNIASKMKHVVVRIVSHPYCDYIR